MVTRNASVAPSRRGRAPPIVYWVPADIASIVRSLARWQPSSSIDMVIGVPSAAARVTTIFGTGVSPSAAAQFNEYWDGPSPCRQLVGPVRGTSAGVMRSRLRSKDFPPITARTTALDAGFQNPNSSDEWLPSRAVDGLDPQDTHKAPAATA